MSITSTNTYATCLALQNTEVDHLDHVDHVLIKSLNANLKFKVRERIKACQRGKLGSTPNRLQLEELTSMSSITKNGDLLCVCTLNST